MNKEVDSRNSMCNCKACCKEIPKSSAVMHEGLDYKLHFCGLVCYNKWQLENLDKNKEKK